ncbi:helicase-related protein [Kitasatospora sp. NPDC047058]|uniref:helicase-related protein n=1 Tax=Kitasatospora sp. NPDC047058 TaxID=3155620 RepID=UPI0033FBC380
MITAASGKPHPFLRLARGYEDGEVCGILCNARLLSEGIDIPAVDVIVFADPKSSVIDIVQAVGRALRQSYRQGRGRRGGCRARPRRGSTAAGTGVAG